MPASLIGLGVLFWLRHHVDVKAFELVTRHASGYALFVAAVIILVQRFLWRRSLPPPTAGFEWCPGQRVCVIAIGAIVCLIVTATSIGSGSVTLPLPSLSLPLVGISNLVASDIAFAALLIPAWDAGQWAT